MGREVEGILVPVLGEGPHDMPTGTGEDTVRVRCTTAEAAEPGVVRPACEAWLSSL